MLKPFLSVSYLREIERRLDTSDLLQQKQHRNPSKKRGWNGGHLHDTFLGSANFLSVRLFPFREVTSVNP